MSGPLLVSEPSDRLAVIALVLRRAEDLERLAVWCDNCSPNMAVVDLEYFAVPRLRVLQRLFDVLLGVSTPSWSHVDSVHTSVNSVHSTGRDSASGENANRRHANHPWGVACAEASLRRTRLSLLSCTTGVGTTVQRRLSRSVYYSTDAEWHTAPGRDRSHPSGDNGAPLRARRRHG